MAVVKKGSRLFERFEIVKVVEKRGVFLSTRARDVKENRLVRLQVLDPDFAVDQATVETLLEYFRRLQGAGGRGVQAPEEALSNGRHPFVAVYSDLPAKPLPKISRTWPGQGLPLWKEAGETLHFLHARGMVHGNVSPRSFVVIENEGKKTVCLTDFGCAPLLERGRLEALRGDGRFVSPEMRLGGRPTQSGDIYSFAQTLAHGNRRLERASWFARATAVRPEQRYRRVRDLLSEIEREYAEKKRTWWDLLTRKRVLFIVLTLSVLAVAALFARLPF